MIAFMTRNSNLVPLLEGLCSSNPCRFEFDKKMGIRRHSTRISAALLSNSKNGRNGARISCAHLFSNVPEYQNKCCAAFK